MDDVLHTESERGLCRNLEPRLAPLGTSIGTQLLSFVSGGKLTFRPAFELDGDIECSSDIPGRAL